MPGLRERQRLQRRSQIVAAAKALFAEKGFDGATTREIAERADVSIKTLFAYAADKRQLLAMVFRDDLVAITERAFATLPAGASFLEQLLHVFRPRVRYWAADPALTRHAMRETFALEYVTENRPAAPEETLLTRVVALTRDHNIDHPEIVATLCVDLYLGAVRRWATNPKPVVAHAMRDLERVLAIALRSVVH